MKKFISLILSLLLYFTAFAQDPSKAILAKLSKKIETYNNVYIEYTIKTENKQEKTENLQDGKILSQKNKFALKTKESEIYCDGAMQWIYLKADNEVAISNADKDSDDLMSNPVKFLTGKSNAFKYSYKDNIEEDGNLYSEINYFPKDLKTPYSYIRLHLNEKTLIPYSIKYAGKDGITYTLRLKTYKPNVDGISDSDFVFDPSKYNGIEIVDLR